MQQGLLLKAQQMIGYISGPLSYDWHWPEFLILLYPPIYYIYCNITTVHYPRPDVFIVCVGLRVNAVRHCARIFKKWLGSRGRLWSFQEISSKQYMV